MLPTPVSAHSHADPASNAHPFAELDQLLDEVQTGFSGLSPVQLENRFRHLLHTFPAEQRASAARYVLHEIASRELEQLQCLHPLLEDMTREPAAHAATATQRTLSGFLQHLSKRWRTRTAHYEHLPEQDAATLPQSLEQLQDWLSAPHLSDPLQLLRAPAVAHLFHSAPAAQQARLVRQLCGTLGQPVEVLWNTGLLTRKLDYASLLSELIMQEAPDEALQLARELQHRRCKLYGTSDARQANPIWHALLHDAPELAEALLRAGYSLPPEMLVPCPANCQERSSLVDILIDKSKFPALQYLIGRGLDRRLERHPLWWSDALHHAICRDRGEQTDDSRKVTRLLLAIPHHVQDLLAVDHRGPLAEAIVRRRMDLVDLLLQSCAPPLATSAPDTVLRQALGTRICFEPSVIQYPLEHAIHLRDPALVRDLCQRGAPLRSPGFDARELARVLFPQDSHEGQEIREVLAQFA